MKKCPKLYIFKKRTIMIKLIKPIPLMLTITITIIILFRYIKRKIVKIIIFFTKIYVHSQGNYTNSLHKCCWHVTTNK